MSRSIWQLLSDARNWDNLTKLKQKELYDSLFLPEIKLGYNYFWLISIIVSKLDNERLLPVIKNLFNTSYKYKNDYFLDVVVGALKRSEIQNKVKQIILDKNYKNINKALLYLDNLSEKEEEIGVRSLSTSKYIPNFIYEKKYKPSVGAIKKLPPVMRLNVLEALTSNINLGYNILENFKDPDEFKNMLFGAVLRHRDRVESVIKRYKDISSAGIPQTFDVLINCEICGDINMTVTTGRIKDNERLNKTNFGRMINYGCPICRKYKTKTNIIWR